MRFKLDTNYSGEEMRFLEEHSCIVVFSCDCNGRFYIRNKISAEWVEERKFLPVIDLETGDYIGFRIKDGSCQSEVSLYLHEENSFRDTGLDFYEALLKYGLKSF